jgi:undecaprenyl diphosphate synthase
MNKGNADGLDREKLPRHIGIVMDGNGRWAQERGLPRTAGHEAGVKAVREIVRACGNLELPVLTLYAFSVENWQRPADEVEFLMELLVTYIGSELDELDSSNVRILVFGERESLPERVHRELRRAVDQTADNSGLTLGLAFNYGGRQEITRAVRHLAQEVAEGKLQASEITTQHISERLYTAGLPDPDLIIRSSGELRLSNFLIWQSAYAEFWWTETYWPDFGKEELLEAIRDYQQRERRFGRISEYTQDSPS